MDDSSRIARDIADAIRVMQQLKFLGIRVIYISQGIDSESEQADALVAVHGLIDSLYLKELAKKVRRGLAGQFERGYATGTKQYGYRKVPVPDPTGRKDVNGNPVLLGKRIEIDEDQAEVIQRIFEWAADGVGVTTIVDRLNREGIPGTGGKRWNKTPVSRSLRNERYLGRQIFGQQEAEREPATGRRIMRNRPRKEWLVEERPELRIISDELWNRVQQTRAEIRERIAPKQNLARGKSGKHHSHHLLTGFTKCAVCGGAISSVSGGKGSPRFGCRRSWQEGLSACTNRLTIRIKVAEPQILQRLQGELLKPEAQKYVVNRLEKALKEQSARPQARQRLARQLEQEKRKLQNLVAAIEGGSSTPAVLLKAVQEREDAIRKLEGELRQTGQAQPEMPTGAALQRLVQEQLGDLVGLLKTDTAKVKSEFRRLNLQLTFHPVEAKPRPHFVVKGQCDLAALVFSFVRPAERSPKAIRGLPGAVLDLTRE